MEGIKASFNIETQRLLSRYFLAEDDKLFAAVRNAVGEMRDAGVTKPIIFAQLMSVLQVLAVTQGLDLPKAFEKVRSTIRMIYTDEEYSQTVSQQLFSILVKSKNHIRETVTPEAPAGAGVSVDQLKAAMGGAPPTRVVTPATTPSLSNPFGGAVPKSYN